ncbi:four-helix bundle copper-binding protein [Methylobacterium terricola]|uniref:Four-helix bundle copper-binding protein n=1 Tax=Methylobacterium terricola TaxID=2583531 RepID=A0A5C4L4B7_9HYPH|nr:four-helix bundle copper-binding protein [Methylobacterium terricola]TNC04779.1 four-helix bundle copper-binding protein [Methylobacterium terricola]
MPTNPDMQACIDVCLRCYQTCLSMASTHCLETGGKHVEPEHFRLMMACAESCRSSAHLMLIGTALHKHQCSACAEVCAACAASCEEVGDMDACVQACRACEASCRKMAA